MNEVIYIPVKLKKDTALIAGCAIAYIDKETKMLKPVLISDLITAVQNSIAPQRQDLHTAIEISINSFLK